MARNDDKNKTPATPAGEDKKTAAETTTGTTTAPAAETKKPEPAKEKTTAQKRSTKPASKSAKRDVDELIATRNLPAWMGESIKVYAGWKSGKEVSDEEFKETLDSWNNRNQGGGKR